MLAPSSTGPRFFSPWEQAACLGLPSTIKLPGSLEIAWHVLGNAIGVAHALLQMSRLHVILGEGSPFSQTTAELPTLCRMMQRKGIHLSGKQQIWVEGCRIWSMQCPSRIETNLSDVVVPSQHVEVTMCEPESPSEPPSKVARFESEITPTAPFVVSDDVESCCKKGLNVEGLQFMAVPSDAEIEKMICDIVQSHVRDEYGVTVMPFAVSNLTARWVHIGWTSEDATVWLIIRAVWPFAQNKWLASLQYKNQEIGLAHCPESLPFRIIKLRPTMVLIRAQVPLSEHYFHSRSDCHGSGLVVECCQRFPCGVFSWGCSGFG